MTVEEENRLRNSRLISAYDPVTGTGCVGDRVRADRTAWNDGPVEVPRSMTLDPEWNKVNDRVSWVKLRCRHDFEFWAVTCARIKDKTTGQTIPFRLNTPQRRILAEMERMRTARHPVRVIMLKARQWGGSTLVQLYMAWYQTVLTTNCHSLICAHVKDTASTIRGIYSKLIDNYPQQYWSGDEGVKPELKPFEGSRNIRTIAGRGCNITIGSSENQEAVRGADYALAHLSEVAFWTDTPSASPEGFIRAICGAINSTENTLIVLESTANGVGNYFHREWLRSERGLSDKVAVFVPWYEIEIYRVPVASPGDFFKSLDNYELDLWNKGLTLEQIAWYRTKSREYPSPQLMHAEYPTTPAEAFASTGNNIFRGDSIENIRKFCRPPLMVGDLHGTKSVGEEALDRIHFVADPSGHMKIWSAPSTDRQLMTDRYVVAVDIGGRSPSSDWSVIAVFDRGAIPSGGKIEVVAQWRGHLDHDLIAWKAAVIARWYRNALLVIESNTLETDNIGGEPSLSILSEICDTYTNLYYRTGIDGNEPRIGFHTNRATKTMVINRLIAMIRDDGYIERDDMACDELTVYQQKGTGFGALDGNHDDIVMTRAIGLYVASELFVDSPDDYRFMRR